MNRCTSAHSLIVVGELESKIRGSHREGYVKGRRIPIGPPMKSGDLKTYLAWLSRQKPLLADRLKSLGFPSDGQCAITANPGTYFGSAYKDFKIDSLEVLLGAANEIDVDRLKGIFYLSGPNPTWLVWRVWLMDIGCEGIESYFRYVWDQNNNSAHVTIEAINRDLHLSQQGNHPHKISLPVIAKLRRLLPGLKLISLAEDQCRGRPEGTGWFKNVKDFRSALKDVLATQLIRPIQLNTLKLLDDHRLCQMKPKGPRTQSHTKTLRDWLHNAGLKNYDEALRRYWKASKTRK